MTARDDATRAGQAASTILAAAEHAILAAMTSAATQAIRGTIPPALARRKVQAAIAVVLGRASSSLARVYGSAVQDVTGHPGTLPDAPGQVATAILRAQQDAEVAFGAVLAAAGAQGSRMPPPSSAYRRIVNRAARQGSPGKAAAAALGAIGARGLTGYVSPAGRRQPLAAYAERAVRTATSALARQPVMSEVTARRDQLAAVHVPAVTAAWNEAATGLDASDAVQAFRADSRSSASGQPAGLLKRWRQEAARAAAVEFLRRIYQSGRYVALLAALGRAVRDGMAEGEADALALAAYRQGLGPFDISRAFAAAGARLEATDAVIDSAARDAADAMIRAAAADIARALANAAGEASDDEITGYVDTFLHGDDVGAVARWTEEALWTAFGAGAVDLYRRAQGSFAGQGIAIDWNNDSSPCALCKENADGSPYSPYEVPAYPGHRRCRCWLTSDTRLPVALLTPFLAAAA